MYYKTVISNHGQLDYIDNLFDNPDYIPVDTERKEIRTKTYCISTNAHILPGLSFEEQSLVRQAMIKMSDIIGIVSTFTQMNNPEVMYEEFKIPKRTGGYRTIDAPLPALKEVQYEVLKDLKAMKVLHHDSAWAYIKGRDIIGALKEHQKNNSRWFLKLDLKDFFGSCDKACIKALLRSLFPFCYVDEQIYIQFIDSLFTIASKDGKLPQGTPLSPYLTNLIMVPIDYNIVRVLNAVSNEGELKKQRYVYTRYADDIIISAKESFNYSWLQAVINQSVLKGTPFKIKDEKTRYGSNAGRNWNLGVMYNKDKDITIGHKKKKYLKIAIHNFINDTDNWSLEDIQTLLGNLSWLRNVEPEYFAGLIGHVKYKYDGKDVWQMLIDKIKEYQVD